MLDTQYLAPVNMLSLDNKMITRDRSQDQIKGKRSVKVATLNQEDNDLIKRQSKLSMAL